MAVRRRMDREVYNGRAPVEVILRSGGFSMPSRAFVPVLLLSLLVVEKPTYLVVVDGVPRTAPIEGTDFLRVVNTKALVLTDGARVYVDVAGTWMGSKSLAGPWAFATGPLSRLDMAREAALAAGATFEGAPTGVATALQRGSVPEVRVVTEPTTLVQLRGAPKLARVKGTTLSRVKNTPESVYFDDASSTWYVFADGGWHRAGAIAGPWEALDGAAVPEALKPLTPPTTPTPR